MERPSIMLDGSEPMGVDLTTIGAQAPITVGLQSLSFPEGSFPDLEMTKDQMALKIVMLEMRVEILERMILNGN